MKIILHVAEGLDELYKMIDSDHYCGPEMGPTKSKLDIPSPTKSKLVGTGQLGNWT